LFQKALDLENWSQSPNATAGREGKVKLKAVTLSKIGKRLKAFTLSKKEKRQILFEVLLMFY